MNISVETRSTNVHGYTHRLWLDNYFQDLTQADLAKLKAAVDSILSPPKRGRGKK
jgi:hypothetical protein